MKIFKAKLTKIGDDPIPRYKLERIEVEVPDDKIIDEEVESEE